MATIEVRCVPTLRGALLRRDIFRGTLPGGTLAAALKFAYFKVGEKGYIVQPGGAQIPKDPADTGLTYSTKDDLEAQNTGVGDRTFTKALVPVDFTPESPATLKVACALLLGDANLAPDLQLFEIGLFIAAIPGYAFVPDIMVGYGTFPRETKNVAIAMTHNIRVTF